MNIEEKIERDIILAPFTTFKIGGSAKFFVEADSPEELVEAVRWAKTKGEKFFILGGGSNLLVSDNGFNGLVIKNNSKRIFREKVKGGEIILCDSGLPLARAVISASRNSLTGLEWAAGLPGSVGGAIRGNAGCFGSEMAAIVKEIEAYDPSTDRLLTLSKEDCEFSYRSSLFKEKNIFVLRCKLALTYGNNDIAQEMEEVIRKRVEHQPKYPSAGSVFKNVPLSEVEDKELLEEAEKENKIVGAGPGGVASAWLIEKLYFKGKQIGGAMVSHEHANFIINKNYKATASDVLMLISLIKQKVRVEFKIQLREEIQYLDF